MKLYDVGLGLVLAFIFGWGVVTYEVDCRQEGVTDVKECASQVWEEREADYSTLNG